jgi:hypothetical protein
VLVSPRGWTDVSLMREFIHWRQVEELGILAVRRKPRWLIEGMAYSLSHDPRRPLPEEMESWRAEFERWYAGLGGWDVWTAARDAW